jgi:methionyl-tRNA formyltransferase
MSTFSCVVMGNESLLIQCGEILRRRGHAIRAVVTRSPEIRAWARNHKLRTEPAGDRPRRPARDARLRLVLSIANLSIVPEAVLAKAAKGAINFHDGPLPRYAGLNAPVWALLNRETAHGVTWHMMENGVDMGDVVERRLFELAPEETAVSLNTRCYAAGIESFEALTAAIEAGGPERRPQDLTKRSFFAHDARPRAAGRLDFRRDAEDLTALVRALDHGAIGTRSAAPRSRRGGACCWWARPPSPRAARPARAPSPARCWRSPTRPWWWRRARRRSRSAVFGTSSARRFRPPPSPPSARSCPRSSRSAPRR